MLSFGLFLVFCQLRSIASEFNHPSPLQGLLDWLNRVRLAINPPPNVTVSVAVTGLAMTSPTATATAVVMRANPDFATSLADLRREFEDRKASDDARYQALLERIDKEGSAILARTASLASAHGALDVQVKVLAVGDLFTAFIGLFLTIAGTIETGLAPEIARLLGG